MQIRQVGMTRNHFEPGNATRIRMIVMHSTAGNAPGDYNWLRQGGSDQKPVSVHYYVDKAGNISQMVDDQNRAWHAGVSTWPVDGHTVNGCNPVSVGIELENRNTGRDPYPQPQYNAALELVRALVAKYRVPRQQLVRHLDISPGRKTDPAGFPWERFVSQVYQAAPTPAATPDSTPTPEPLQPSQQLRKLLVDLAYRAAGTSHPAGWPLLKEAVSHDTGMPIVAITATASGDGEGQDDQARAVTLPGQAPLVLEAYGRDLFYASPDHLDQVQRLSATPSGPLRDALLMALFQASDPANGFKTDWTFHQLYLNHMTEIGVPIGANHRVAGATSNGQTYACQHYALDTLCSPVGQWNTVIRLSDLTRDMYGADPHQATEKELRLLLLNDLYNTRTGRAFDAGALFCRYAIAHNLGAPQGKAEVQILEGQRLVAMPYTLDVLYCRIPGDGNWDNVTIGELPGVLGDDDAGLARLSTLLAQGDVDMIAPAVLGDEDIDDLLPRRVYTGGLLGAETDTPAITDLTLNVGAGGERGATPIDLVIVYPTAGPANADLANLARPDATVWHYYVDHTGAITRLIDESRAAHSAGGATWQGHGDLDRRALTVAVEAGAVGMTDDQSTALAWLLHDLMQRYKLTRAQLIQGSDLGLGSPLADWQHIIDMD